MKIRIVLLMCLLSGQWAWAQLTDPSLTAVADTTSTLVVAENQEAELAYNAGVLAFKSGKLRAAVDSFSVALQYRTDFDKALFNRGLVYSELNDFNKALSDFDALLKINPRYSPEVYYHKGLCFFGQHEYLKAAGSFEEAIAKKYESADNYYYLGVCRFLDDNLDVALSSFNKAIALNPNFAYAYHDRASAYRKKDDLLRANADYEQAIKLKPNWDMALSNRAAVLISLKRYTEAIGLLDKCLLVNKTHYMALNHRGIANFYLQNWAKAEADFLALNKLRPDYAPAAYNLANTYAAQKQFAEAAKWYSKAIELDKDYANAYFARGSVWEEMGKFDKATADWKMALKLGLSIAQQHIDYYK